MRTIYYTSIALVAHFSQSRKWVWLELWSELLKIQFIAFTNSLHCCNSEVKSSAASILSIVSLELELGHSTEICIDYVGNRFWQHWLGMSN